MGIRPNVVTFPRDGNDDFMSPSNISAPPNWMEWTLTNRLFNLNFWKIRADLNIPQVLESSVYRDLTRNDNKFDLIFTELFFGFEPLAVLGHIFQAPVVTYASYGYNPDILRYIGAANGVAYLPHFELDYAGPMSLLQRLENALIQFSVMLYNEYWYYPRHDAVLAEYIPGPLPRITDMLRNTSLFLLTSNPALRGAKLYPPNVIEISGIHFKDPAPLDEVNWIACCKKEPIAPILLGLRNEQLTVLQ